MILEYFVAILAASLIVLAGHLLILGANNRKKYQFFEKNAPGLKVVKNPSLFGGHTNRIMHAQYNWAMHDKLFDEYGPTVGYYYDTRPVVITKDLDFIKTFTIDEQIHTNRIKPNIPIREFEDDCIAFANDDQWYRIRKVVAPAFSAHRIKSPNVRANINGVIDKLVDLIERRLKEAETREQSEDFIDDDIEDISHRFVLGLVFSGFYKQNDVIDFYSEKDKYVNMIEQSARYTICFLLKACAAFPAIKPLISWLMLKFHSQGVMRTTIMNYIKQQTKQNFEAERQLAEERRNKMAASEKGFEQTDTVVLDDGSKFKRNMIDYITDQYREGKLTKDEYFNSTFFLFFAADKTTTDSLARLLYNLARHPQVQEKLRDSILAEGEDSEYLSWCISETLRLHPPVHGGCSRVIKRDIQTKHGLVPAGTFVITPAYTINRLKEYWGEDAEEFRPERWANAKSFHPVQYLAFGGGRRVCPGRELALMEIKMVMNVLLRRYKFDNSRLHTIDNSKRFISPMMFFLSYDTPTFVRISRYSQKIDNDNNNNNNSKEQSTH